MFDLFNGQQETINSISTASSTEAPAASFDRFWAIYPRKVAKKAASIAWAKLKPSSAAQALEALENHVRLWQAEGRSSEYIPHAATWLNGARWEDEIEMPKPKEGPKVAWWSTESLILAKGAEYGLKPRPAEGWHEFKGRIMEAMKA